MQEDGAELHGTTTVIQHPWDSVPHSHPPEASPAFLALFSFSSSEHMDARKLGLTTIAPLGHHSFFVN